MGSALAVRDQWAVDVSDWALSNGQVVRWLDRSPRRPSLDLVASGPAAQRLLVAWLDARPWLWRIGSPGSRMLGGALTGARLTWTAQGGARICAHAPGALGISGLSALALRARSIGGNISPGLHAAPSEFQLLFLMAQVGHLIPSDPELTHEARHLAARCDLDRLGALARVTGLETVLIAASPMIGGGVHEATKGGARVREAARRLVRTRRARTAASRLRPPVTCRFDALEFLVGGSTFWPRPESEGLVHAATDQLKTNPAGRRPLVVDVGTGCGAVAVAVAVRFPEALILATDIEASALKWARRNARRLAGRRVRVAQGSLLETVPASWFGRVDVITANVPFLLRADFEGAADTGGIGYLGEGDDGLGLHRRLVEQASQVLRRGGLLAVQTDAAKAAGMRHVASDAGLVGIDSTPAYGAMITVACRD